MSKRIWFTSDHHFGHANIIKYCNRPFNSVEEMDAKLIENWNAVVGPDDDVYYLGDFSLKLWVALQTIPKLNGKVTLIVGNHDLCFFRPQYAEDYIKAGFVEVHYELVHKFGDQSVLLTHFPYRNTNYPQEKYHSRRPVNNIGQYAWHLCGHIHDSWKQKGREINVGVDVWDYTPVSEEQIIELMSAARF